MFYISQRAHVFLNKFRSHSFAQTFQNGKLHHAELQALTRNSSNKESQRNPKLSETKRSSNESSLVTVFCFQVEVLLGRGDEEEKKKLDFLLMSFVGPSAGKKKNALL